MKPRAIPKPYRLPILERLARDGDAYAMYALARAFPPGVRRVAGATAREWLERAARTLLKAQLALAETDAFPGEESPADLRAALRVGASGRPLGRPRGDPRHPAGAAPGGGPARGPATGGPYGWRVGGLHPGHVGRDLRG